MSTTILVGPTAQRPTHDISLTDGTTTIGLRLCDGRGTPTPLGIRQGGVSRTSLQVRQGDPDYSAYELPYTPMTQKDWSGGRGQEDFGKDSTKYYDSYRVDTRGGDVVLGPKATEVNPASSFVSNSGWSAYTLEGGESYAVSFTPTVNISLRAVKITLTNTAAVRIYVNVLTDSSGPDLPVGGGGNVVLYVPEANTTPREYTVYLTATLSASTLYYLYLNPEQDIAVSRAAETGENIYIFNTGTWGIVPSTGENATIVFTLYNLPQGESNFFEYKGILFILTRPDDGGAPKLFYNGIWGAATSNASDKSKLNTTRSLSGYSLAGKYVRITAGTGSTEEQNWRKISTNSTSGSNDTITVSPSWNITHDTTTIYYVYQQDSWTEVTGHGLTGPVTDVLVVDDILYIAQGDAINIRRGRIKSDGTWDTWADDGTNKATFLALINSTDGTRRVWRANATTSQVSAAPVVAWGTNLTFATAVTCGNPRYKITGLEPYGNPSLPWILKEDSIGSIGGTTATTAGVYAEIPLREMRSVADDRNGRAHCQFGVYLMFSLLDGMERYYDQRLDDIGPNLGEGFPDGRQGPIYHMIPYPGGVIACVDAGSEGYSSVLFWNQLGWHELYRGAYGKRIRRVYVQVIPGEAADRLWVSEGDTTYWLPICLNTRKQSDYTYYTGGDAYIISSWFYGGFKEINKFWKSLTAFTEKVELESSATVSIQGYYQTDVEDDGDAWHALPSAYTTPPVQEIALSSTYNVTGKRWRYKLVFITNTATATPRLLAVTVDSVTRIPTKRSWSVSFLASDAMRQISDGAAETISYETLIAQLMTWADTSQGANSTKPLTLGGNLAYYDSKKVFIDPLSINLIGVQLNQDKRVVSAVCTMTMYEA